MKAAVEEERKKAGILNYFKPLKEKNLNNEEGKQENGQKKLKSKPRLDPVSKGRSYKNSRFTSQTPRKYMLIVQKLPI